MEPGKQGHTSTNAPRKVKFAPKGPPRRVHKPVVPKVEKIEESDNVHAQELLRRFNETKLSIKPKGEKKAPVQVAFGYGGASTSNRTYSATKDQGSAACAPGLREGKEYKEPWDYYSYYPVSLPFRRPYSGNPEILDEQEFSGNAENMTQNEYATKSAEELGLMEENLEAGMLFFQLPSSLPSSLPQLNQSAVGDGKEPTETRNSSKPLHGSGPSKLACSLDELPAGFMGKMLVYRSGAVKLKLGDTLYNVWIVCLCRMLQS